MISSGVSSVPQKLESVTYYDHFLSVIPNNILQPFLSGNVLSVMLIAAAVGLALAFMPKTENRAVLLKGLLGLQEVLFALIRALLWILPLGILAFSAQLSAQIEAGIIVSALGKYTLVILGGNLIQFFIVLPIFLAVRGLNPIHVFRKMLRPLPSPCSPRALPAPCRSPWPRLNSASTFILRYRASSCRSARQST